MARKRLKTSVRKTTTAIEEEDLGQSAAPYVYGDEAVHELEAKARGPYNTDTHERFGTTIANGKEFLRGVDGRTWRAREMKLAYQSILNDLGGADNVTFAKSEIARKCAAMHVLSLEFETALALGDAKDWDFDQYIILSRAQAQLFKLLGLERRAKPINDDDDLDAYLRKVEKHKNR